MKLLITALLLIGFSTTSFSQIRVYLKNGEVKEGTLGKVGSGYVSAKHYFKLKQKKKGKSEKFKAKNIDSIVVSYDSNKEVYHAVEDVYGRPKIYKLHKNGKIYIYKGETTTTTAFGSFNSVFYAYRRKGERRCLNLHKGGPYWSNFAKVASEYFADCPILSEKINNREKGFTNKDTLEVVEYYNEKCD